MLYLGKLYYYVDLEFYQFTVLLSFCYPLRLYLLQEALLVGVKLLHVKSDGGLSLCLGAVVGHWNGIVVSVLGCYASNEQAGLLGVVDRVGEQTGDLLWGVEGGTMRCDGIVPTPLTLTQQGLDWSHLGLGSTLVDDELCLEVSAGQFLLGTVAHLVALLLT